MHSLHDTLPSTPVAGVDATSTVDFHTDDSTPIAVLDAVAYEPLLDKAVNRFIVYPIKDQELWSFYQKALSSFWVPGEISLENDIIDWKARLNSKERTLLSYVLAFFAASDGIVNENLAARFMQEVTLIEARCFYGFQIAMENIHAETYATLITSFVEVPEERDKMFNAMNEIESVADKANWALNWIEDRSAPFAVRLAAFAAVEGIFFSSSFAIIFWIKSRGLMQGLCHANEFIARDEGLHQEFACKLFARIQHKPDAVIINNMIGDAVHVEKKFIKDALPHKLPGMNHQLMCQYIEYVADRLLSMLGYAKLYGAANPFDFMESISVEGKANFFERQVSAYRIPNVAPSSQTQLMSKFDYTDVENLG